ncbi:MAG: phosphotransferase [Chloroflexi bacterium]|nr:phosphotransferase [Chloroflexota bacterium]MYD38720.1 phosphotransferase [Chloroflexota bacterium]
MQRSRIWAGLASLSSEWFRVRDSFDHSRVAQLVAERWQGESASISFISSAYNIVFRFEREGRGYYLRVCHVALHPLPKARQVMHFLLYLARCDVPVGAPIPAVSGEYIEVLADGYFASAQSEAPGKRMSRNLRDVAVFEAWGQSLGKLHAASRQYQADASIPYQFPTVQSFWQNIAPTIAAASVALRRAYAELSDWMRGLPCQDYGLTHGDHRPGNVIWDGTTARIIDFDEPNYHWYAADIARALLELWERPFEERVASRKAFLRGYLREHSIDERWVSELPFFIQHRVLLMVAWTLQEGGSPGRALDWALKRVAW